MVQIAPAQAPLAQNANNANNAEEDEEATATTVNTAGNKNGIKDLIDKGNEKKTESIDDGDVPLAQEVETVAIDENETPLVDSVVNSNKKSIWWWWILIVAAITGTAGKTAYDKKHKKGLFKEKNKDNK